MPYPASPLQKKDARGSISARIIKALHESKKRNDPWLQNHLATKGHFASLLISNIIPDPLFLLYSALRFSQGVKFECKTAICQASKASHRIYIPINSTQLPPKAQPHRSAHTKYLPRTHTSMHALDLPRSAIFKYAQPIGPYLPFFPNLHVRSAHRPVPPLSFALTL